MNFHLHSNTLPDSQPRTFKRVCVIGVVKRAAVARRRMRVI
jgi:hypothetical protein